MASTNAPSWTCLKCTFINETVRDDVQKCEMCEEPRPSPQSTRPSNRKFTNSNMGSSIRISSIKRDSHVHFGEESLNVFAQFSGDDEDDNCVENGSGGGGKNPGDTGSDEKSNSNNNSLAALGNMSFAAWESDRQSWTCKTCTFVNEPRFLMCGACGMSEGSAGGAIVEDELVSQGLGHMSLSSAQEFLMETVHKQLEEDRVDSLRKERVVELLEDQVVMESDQEYKRSLTPPSCSISSSNVGESSESKGGAKAGCSDDASDDDRKQSATVANARNTIETLERIQAAEKEEHSEILITIQQWRESLRETPDEAQEQQLKKQEDMLKNLVNEWNNREKEIKQMKMRIEGTRADI